METGSITPQYHVVYDDHFTTLPATMNDADEQMPEHWRELLEHAREIAYDTDDPRDIPPDLHIDWLTDAE